MSENTIESLFKETEEEFKKQYNSGSVYNLFNELGISSDEVKHSSMLKSLIDPNGSHGCGSLFYKSFIENIGFDINIEKYDWLNDIKNVKIHAEYFIGNRDHIKGIIVDENYGRIDLLIENTNKNKALIIENKVYACDQPQQLKRYYEFGISKYGGNVNFEIIYLNLKGDPVSVQSIEGINESFEIININYSIHILKWLEECLNSHIENRELQPINSNIYSIVYQYSQLIRQLTEKSQHFIEYFKNDKYPSITTKEIVAKRDDLRKEFFVYTMKYLNEKLKNYYNLQYIVGIKELGRKTIGEILLPNNHKKNFGIKITSKNNSNDTFFIEVQNYSKLIYGIFDPIEENEICKKMLEKGYVYKPFWLLKEYPIFNSNDVQFPFYDDFLNFTFMNKGEEIAVKFAKEIIKDLNSIYE